MVAWLAFAVVGTVVVNSQPLHCWQAATAAAAISFRGMLSSLTSYGASESISQNCVPVQEEWCLAVQVEDIQYRLLKNVSEFSLVTHELNHLMHTERLQIPHLRPTEYKRSRLSRNRRTVNRPYGGVLSGGAVRERIIRAFLVEEQKIVKKVVKIQKAKEKLAAKA
ncbi:hypothetical protein RD792_014167 [Penstemon davidsonii]|uniref:60S ribosomal protein L34 n=1 Tax=Penstemon davidsonii TaxID=160366 RepID=A0ABR0CNQ9_9LAMI|nr:hypothetical protein RD792_014167 [Penstemon davidsonii]